MNSLLRSILIPPLFLVSFVIGEDRELTRRNSEPDHLCKETRNINESSSLIEMRSLDRTLLSLRKGIAGRYILHAQEPVTNSQWKRQYIKAEIEISEELANEVIQLWAHELQRIPAGSEAIWGDIGGPIFHFTIRESERKWLHGRTVSPKGELPPLWMTRAAESLIAHVFSPSNQSHLANFRRSASRILEYSRGTDAKPQQDADDQLPARAESKAE